MADTLTTNYNFVKPEVGASTDTWGGKINSDLDSIDSLIKSVNNALVAAPVVSNAPTLVSMDWDLIPATPGWFPQLLGPGANTLNAPNNAQYFFCLTLAFNTNITQIAYPYSLAASMAQGIWYRGRYGGTWTAWRNIASTDAAGNLNVAASIGSGGAITSTNNITSGGHLVANSSYLIGSTTAAYLGPLNGGTSTGIFFRPTNYSSTVGEVKIFPTGSINTPGDVTCVNSRSDQVLVNGGISITGATSGSTSYATGAIYHSSTLSTAFDFHRFYNPSAPNLNGRITTTTTTTNYATSSDENFKELDAEMDPAQAIAIIRADPVLAFTWKETGEQAVGWFAQRSHAIDSNLAVPPSDPTEEDIAMRADPEVEPKPGDPGYVPWGIDYGRRTPYLWAALSNALDRIEALEAKLSILEGKPSG